jgi:hypothetical protein
MCDRCNNTIDHDWVNATAARYRNGSGFTKERPSDPEDMPKAPTVDDLLGSEEDK